MSARGWLRSSAAAVAALMLGFAPALSQLDFAFMPKGGKDILLDVLGSRPNTDELRTILTTKRNEADWRQAMSGRVGLSSDRELRTLAAYLAGNLPVQSADTIVAKASGRAELYEALPRDGRELAWNECQSCHSLFTGYLTQDRSIQAWRNTFFSPFHRELKMTTQEREEFAQYSAINMPMAIDDVPRELRF